MNDGYECLSSATFNGVNTTISYNSIGINADFPLHTVQFAFRSKDRGGPVLLLKNELSRVRFIRIDIESRGVVTRWITDAASTVSESVHAVSALDGEWHSVDLDLAATIGLSGFSLSEMLVAGQITVGGSTESHNISERDVEFETLATTSSWVVSTADSGDAVLSDVTNSSSPMIVVSGSSYYRGCLNEMRIGGLLLPFFAASDLINDPSLNKFRPSSAPSYIENRCRLCYDHECQNGAKCLDELTEYSCNCLQGFQGETCEINIDECSVNLCQNGVCVDGIANYSCDCVFGWTGWL